MNRIIKWLENRFFQSDKSPAPGTNFESDSFIGSALEDDYDDGSSDISSCDITVPDLKIIDDADLPGSVTGKFDPYDTIAKHKERSYDQ